MSITTSEEFSQVPTVRFTDAVSGSLKNEFVTSPPENIDDMPMTKMATSRRVKVPPV